MKSPRKDQLKSLLLGLGEAVPEPAVPRVRALDEPRAVSGSVKAMSRSLGELGAAAEEAAALRAQIAAGETIVDLDPGLIDPSFVSDRLDRAMAADGGAGQRDTGFLDDIRSHGQKVPVLVRPHPEAPGRYQIAYGHRRLAAARALGRPVKAQVRALSDADLVVAQGQENAQRRDLSFIEKALFARALDERGFDRATLMAALAVQTAEISRLLSVARSVPAGIAARIGAAPRAGRPRWMALAERLENKGAEARVLSALERAAHADSDTRFALAFAAAAPKTERAAPDIVLRDTARKPLARLSRRGSAAILTIDEAHCPEFADHLVARLPALYAAFLKGNGG